MTFLKMIPIYFTVVLQLAALSSGLHAQTYSPEDTIRTDNLCGPRCVAVASYLMGKPFNLGEFTKACDLTSDGISLLALKKAVENAGFDADVFKSTWPLLLAEEIPVILFVKNDHYIVADPRDKTIKDSKPAIRIYDFPNPSALMTENELAQMWKGEVLKILPKRPATWIGVPEIRFERLLLDYGTLKPGSQATGVFSFSNVGGEPLKILDVQKSCGCTEALVSEDVIQPGQSATVNVKVDLQGRTGPQIQLITLATNDPRHASIDLVFQGTVEEGLYFTRNAVDFGNLVRGTRSIEHLSIGGLKDLGDAVTLISNDRSTAISFSVSHNSNKDSKQTPESVSVGIEAITDSSTPLGMHGSILRINDRTKDVAYDIPITINVIPSVTLEPESISFGVLTPGETVSKQIRIVNHAGEELDARSFKSEFIDDENAGFRPEIASMKQEGKDWILELALEVPKTFTTIERTIGDCRLKITAADSESASARLTYLIK